ncbi:MATE family efflux transporter [Thalassotalea mangrovi]|uniref:Multidrug-efflux transporter n=1 Tax=Thalassotalea mangrovi TaxID=2572245 RepID=A0A4U1B553_9GAMM|nr:MATE family efflux transporter [Thalassotalea mangrovi]TKB45514.1 MATE family efflux transporter [Thalassotalea mangrovi]
MSFLNVQSLKDSIKLAWPISLQQTLVTMLGMIDVMMVSHLGDAAVASVGLGNRIQFVVMIIVMGVAWGVGVLASQYYGAGKLDKLRRSILMGISVAVLALIPVVLLNFLYADDVMALGSTDSKVIALGESYLWITMPSLFFIAAILVFENALRSMNQVKLPMLMSAVAITLNIIFNYWLINGGLGIEPLGVDGAAIATTVSRFLHLVILIAFIVAIRHPVKPTAEDISSLKDSAAWKKLVTLVWPMMFSFGVWSMGTFVYQLIFGRIGTQELAVMSVLAPVEGMFISLFFGFASACAIMVGQRLGAEKFEEAWSIARTFAMLAPVIAVIAGLLLYTLKSLVFIPFSDLPSSTIDLASDIFLIIALGAWIKITNMTFAMGMLRAGGETKACLYIDTIGMWMISIPLTIIAAFYFKLPLFWVVVVTYSEEVCKFILFGWRVASKKWLRNLTHE